MKITNEEKRKKKSYCKDMEEGKRDIGLCGREE